MIEPLPEEISFAELSNNQQNIWKLLDAHNQLVRWIREVAQEEEEVIVECTHENSYLLRPGLMRCKDCKVIYKV